MQGLKEVLAIIWDRIQIFIWLSFAVHLLGSIIASLGETRPAYVIDVWSLAAAIAMIMGFTLFGWELRRLFKGE